MSDERKTFGCAKWRCSKINPDYLAFGVGCPTKRTYCLGHIPRRVQFKMWLRGES